jgi:hypothetical protein
MKIRTDAKIRIAKHEHSKSKCTELRHCYISWSKAKEDALIRCRLLQIQYDGEDLRIIDWNSFVFSVGFYGIWYGKKAFFYITAFNDYVLPLE